MSYRTHSAVNFHLLLTDVLDLSAISELSKVITWNFSTRNGLIVLHGDNVSTVFEHPGLVNISVVANLNYTIETSLIFHLKVHHFGLFMESMTLKGTNC